MPYLQFLDALLSEHTRDLSRSFTRAQLDHVRSAQMPDGGFSGRQGQSDLYYTDFGLRLIVCLDPRSDMLHSAAEFVASVADTPNDVVECFCLLNSARLLGRCGITLQVDLDAITQLVLGHSLASGGFGGLTGALSAYHTFIGALACEILQQPMPDVQAARTAITALRSTDGGFCERPGQGVGQTSATAAAVGFLLLIGGLEDTPADNAVDFLARLQTPDGGLAAHPQVGHGDLLSTFTGMVTLAAFDGLHRLDLAAVARFLRAVARPSGGFSACLSAPSADVEYTYYGLGCMALSRSAARHHGK